MRKWATLIHRWAGLYMAFFLTVAGLTGSILAFHSEVDTWLDPATRQAEPTGPRIDPVSLYELALQHATPQVRMDAINLESRIGKPVYFLAEAAMPVSGTASDKLLREVRLNPYTGQVMTLRWTREPLFPLTRSNLIALIYALHYRLALPGGIGTWLFGVAAIIWTFDCFVGAYLTFPLRRKSTSAAAAKARWFSRWLPAWKLRWRAGWPKLNFDLHRAGGLWVWPMLLIFAWSSVGLNLGDEVYSPVMQAVFDMPADTDRLPLLDKPLERPALSWREALERGRRLALEQSAQQGFAVQGEKELSIDRARGLYRYTFASSGDIGHYGGASVLFDANTGALRALALQDRAAVGTQVSDWLFALHFGAVWGLPMQIFVSLMGMTVAMLSITGLIIWWRKRRARRFSRARTRTAAIPRRL